MTLKFRKILLGIISITLCIRFSAFIVMVLQSSTPGSVAVGKTDLCVSLLQSYEIKSPSLPKTCSAQVLGIDNSRLGGGIQSCKLCGHSEIISNMLLCDCCEDAFHVSCCNFSVVLPFDEWFCHSCLKILRKMSQNNLFLKSPSNCSEIASCEFQLGPTTVLGIGDFLGGDNIMLCKLCGQSENVSNMLLCDCCEDAFHVSCCKLSVVLPIDEWFCHSCLKIIDIMSQNNSLLKSPRISPGVDSCTLQLGPIAVQGIDDSLGGDIQSCKKCGHSEHVSNMLLCDRCEEAFHVSCCKPRVVFPIDEWFCHSCTKIIHKTSQNNSFLKSTSSSWRIGSHKFELGPIAVMLNYPEPYTSKVRIGEAFQAEVPDWCDQISVASLPEVQTDDSDCSSAVVLDPTHSDCADSEIMGSGTGIASRKRKHE